jgi:hypothetical protein
MASNRFGSCRANERNKTLRSSGRKRLRTSARLAHIGARSGVEMTHIATLPPSRRTRRNSSTPRAGSGKNCRPSWQTTASKLASRNGNAWLSAATGRNGVQYYNPVRALVSISTEMSAPTSTPSAPTRGSAIRTASPVPVETSRTRDFWSHGGGSEHRRNKEPRPPAGPPIVYRSIDRLPRCGMETSPERLTHRCRHPSRQKKPAVRVDPIPTGP